MGKIFWEKEEIKNIVEDYNINNLSIVMISKKYGYCTRTISNLLKSQGAEVKLGLRKLKPSLIQLNTIKELSKKGASCTTIAKVLNLDPTTVKRFSEENNIKIHYTISPDFEENFFENIDSEEKAYILGFLFTDGNIKKDESLIRLQLQKQDLEILEKIKKILKINTKIQYDARPGKEGYTLSWSSTKMVEDLAKYGIVPRKTYLTDKLPQVPDIFLIPFLRGLFDGDGGLSISADFSTDVSLTFTSYHQLICEEFQSIIDKLINKEKHNKINNHTGNDGSHRTVVSWRGRQQVLKILDLLYKNANFYLDRKYQKYLKLKDSLK